MTEVRKQDETHEVLSPLTEKLPEVMAALTLHVGPLPPPESVERYELVMSGAFDRMLTMAEQDQQNKFERSRTVLTVYEHNVRSAWHFAQCGQVFGFVTVIIFFAILAYAMYLGNERMFGIILGAGALAGLVQLVRSFQNKGENKR